MVGHLYFEDKRISVELKTYVVNVVKYVRKISIVTL